MPTPFQDQVGMNLFQREPACLIAQCLQLRLFASRQGSARVLPEQPAVATLAVCRCATLGDSPKSSIVQSLQRPKFLAQSRGQIFNRRRDRFHQTIHQKLLQRLSGRQGTPPKPLQRWLGQPHGHCLCHRQGLPVELLYDDKYSLLIQSVPRTIDNEQLTTDN